MTMIIFCSDPMEPKSPDYIYKDEFDAANSLGFHTALFSFEELQSGNLMRALRFVPATEKRTEAVYRGWMLDVETYAILYRELAKRNIVLINNPDEYKLCHHFPSNYGLIHPLTPKSVVVPVHSGFDLTEVHAQLGVFGAEPIIVKDYVKSRKHEWLEACFIPSATDREAVERVTGKFIELQGEDLTGGLVYRKFEQFEQIGIHSRSNLPLFLEYRLFFWRNELLLKSEYWEEGKYTKPEADIPFDEFVAVAGKISSRFFSMDIARMTTGKWLIVELGDGQTAGLPDKLPPDEFYQKLLERTK